MEAGQICKSNIFVVFPDVQNLKHKNCISKVFFFFSYTAGCDSRHGVCLHLSSAAEAPGAV